MVRERGGKEREGEGEERRREERERERIKMMFYLHFRRDILTRYAQCLDMTKLYEESFSLLYDALGQVEKDSEYVQLIRDNTK